MKQNRTRMIAVVLCAALCLSVIGAEAAGSMSASMQVTGGWLRLRSAPSYNAETIASYFTGTIVTVLGKTGNWYHVQLPDGMTGYMDGRYLKPAGGGGGGGGTGGATATVTSPNGLGVRMRTGPSTAYGVIRVLPVGTVVSVLRSGTFWSYIRYGKVNGYMMSQYLNSGSPTPEPMPPAGYTAYVISPNGYGVRLRSGPGLGYDILGVYSVGTEATVLAHGATWDYIKIGTRRGYMMTQFLSKVPVSTVITSVALSDSSPVTGDVLYAVVQPAGATVTYKWMDGNGKLLGTDATYTVSMADVGIRIRLTVTGTGLYSGSATSPLSQQVKYSAKITKVTISDTTPYVGEKLTATLTPAGATAGIWWYRADGACVGTGDTYTVQNADLGRGLAVRAIGTGSYTGDVYSEYTDPVAPKAPETPIPLSGSIVLPSTALPNETITAAVSLNSGAVTYEWYLNGHPTGLYGISLMMPDTPGAQYRLRATATGSGYTGYVESNTVTVKAKSVELPESAPESVPESAPESAPVIPETAPEAPPALPEVPQEAPPEAPEPAPETVPDTPSAPDVPETVSEMPPEKPEIPVTPPETVPDAAPEAYQNVSDTASEAPETVPDDDSDNP